MCGAVQIVPLLERKCQSGAEAHWFHFWECVSGNQILNPEIVSCTKMFTAAFFIIMKALIVMDASRMPTMYLGLYIALYTQNLILS